MRHPLFHDRFVESWQGEDAVDVPVFEALPLEQLLCEQHDTDAHTAAYIVVDPEGSPLEQMPRLGIRCLSSVRADGGEVWMRAVLVDLDRNPHTPWDSSEDAEAAVELVSSLLPHAAVFATGQGLRVIFKLQQLVSPEDFHKIALCALREVQANVERVKAKLDVTYDDTCTQWSRLSRLPLVIRDGKSTAASTFLRIPSPWPAWFPGSDSVRNITNEIDSTLANLDLRDIPAVPPEPGAAKSLATRAMLVAPLRLRKAAKELLEGKPFYAQGERNAKTYSTIMALLSFGAARGVVPSAEEVYGLFFDSVEASTGTRADVALQETWGMAQRLVARAATIVALEEQAASDALQAALDRSRIPALVYTNKVRYVWDPILRSYGDPTSNDQTLLADITRLHPLAALNDRGKMRPVHAILRTDGVRVRSVRYRLGIRGSRLITKDGHHFLEAGVGSIPEIPAIYHEDCAEYLSVVVAGDPDGEKLIHWIATSIQLDRPTTALLLRGAPGAGKNMIVDALAQVMGGKSEFAKVMRQFNAGMLHTPLIHLDEGVDDLKRTGPVSNQFRALIGARSVQVEAKGVDPVDVEGNYRVAVTSNNPHPIPLNNAVNMDDFKALAARVLPIYMCPEASAYLKGLGGYSATTDWVTRDLGDRTVPGKLAEHFAWLVENAEVPDYRNRFLVPTEISAWHVQALLQGVLRDVLMATAAGIQMGSGAAAAVTAHEGRAYVALTPKFLSLVNKHGDGKYEMHEIREAVRTGFSDGQPPIRLNSTVFYPIPTDVLLAVIKPEFPDVYVDEAQRYRQVESRLTVH